MLNDSDAKANIRENVQRFLSAKGWTQADLARVTKESEMRISLMARGKKLPSAAFLARVAEALGTTANDLLASPPKKSRSA